MKRRNFIGSLFAVVGVLKKGQPSLGIIGEGKTKPEFIIKSSDLLLMLKRRDDIKKRVL